MKFFGISLLTCSSLLFSVVSYAQSGCSAFNDCWMCKGSSIVQGAEIPPGVGDLEPGTILPLVHCETTSTATDGFCPDARPAAGIVGLGFDAQGPFTNQLEDNMIIRDDGGGYTSFIVKGLEVGESYALTCLAEPHPRLQNCLTAYGDIRYRVLPNCSEQCPVSVSGIELSHPSGFFNNPIGGGLGFFPGKTNPQDVDNNSVVTISAMTGAPNTWFYLRSFDPDDPSSDSAPVDSNGSAGDDNRGVPNTGMFFDSGLDQTAARSDASGYVQTQFDVSMHPGDNFQIVASCN
ncbi:MAG: hypothetical protein HKN43_01710, partial [Rhodothermales bacterium]|nr:hypothetical protein [Rhodothermales bacterium]